MASCYNKNYQRKHTEFLRNSVRSFDDFWYDAIGQKATVRLDVRVSRSIRRHGDAMINAGSGFACRRCVKHVGHYGGLFREKLTVFKSAFERIRPFDCCSDWNPGDATRQGGALLVASSGLLPMDWATLLDASYIKHNSAGDFPSPHLIAAIRMPALSRLHQVP
jgi:hypothetical protein